jgi:PAS domain S-box-containing protein
MSIFGQDFDPSTLPISVLRDAVICKDLTGKVFQWDLNAERLFGFRRDEIIGRSIDTIIPADRRAEEAMIRERLISGEGIDGLETIRVAKDGTLRRVALCVAPVQDDSGKIVAGIKFARDITESKSRSDEALLLRASEAEHRAKNILATVLAMIRLSHGGSADELKNVLTGRIRALADVTSMTSLFEGAGANIGDVLSNEFWSTSKEAALRVSLEGPQLRLSGDQAQGVALIAHELVTNSIKYGALSQLWGQLSVHWWRKNDSIELVWSEIGARPIDKPATEGFGSRLIRSVASQSLKGQVTFDWSSPRGLKFTLVFPI